VLFGHYDITEILLKAAVNTIKPTSQSFILAVDVLIAAQTVIFLSIQRTRN